MKVLSLTNYRDGDIEGIKVGDKFTFTDHRWFVVTNVKIGVPTKLDIKWECGGIGVLDLPYVLELINSDAVEKEPHSDYGIHLLVDKLDPLDQLEATTKQDIANSNKVLNQIALMREIDLKQVEIDELIEAQNKRLEEYEKGVTHER